jgi:hypothetical protein
MGEQGSPYRARDPRDEQIEALELRIRALEHGPAWQRIPWGVVAGCTLGTLLARLVGELIR